MCLFLGHCSKLAITGGVLKPKPPAALKGARSACWNINPTLLLKEQERSKSDIFCMNILYSLRSLELKVLHCCEHSRTLNPKGLRSVLSPSPLHPHCSKHTVGQKAAPFPDWTMKELKRVYMSAKGGWDFNKADTRWKGEREPCGTALHWNRLVCTAENYEQFSDKF